MESPVFIFLTLLCFVSANIKSKFYDLVATDIHGNDVKFDAFKGKVVMVVNVASKCGFTDDHYKQLEKMFETLGKDDLFIVAAFPCDQFGNQEPGSNDEISDFVHNTYQVTFPLFSKTITLGHKASPVWKWLTGTSGVEPQWNFYKYLIDHKGFIIDVFPPGVSVDSIYDTVTKAVKAAAKAKKSKKSKKKDLKDEL